jgi:protein-ribulosamine 3-kinase
MLPAHVRSCIESGLKTTVQAVKYVGGGSINETARIETSAGTYFVKWNSASRFPGMFAAEEKGLLILRECSGFVVPEVVLNSQAENTAFLVMDFIERAPSYWSDAGKILANMHRSKPFKHESFGLNHDNFIGSLTQSNKIHDSWAGFFSNERILPQMKMAIDNGQLGKSDLNAAEQFCKRIDELFPEEKPVLLHGDLWSGNFMFTSNGPAVFDPAVYWGHREMDIAMTKLFGGFDEGFYIGYNEDYTLEKNWEKRIDYCNLYPLLVHVNLFGGGYVNDVRRILNHFT